VIYPKPTTILLKDASTKNHARGGRPKDRPPLNRTCKMTVRLTQYESDIISLTSHVLGEEYHTIMVNQGMKYCPPDHLLGVRCPRLRGPTSS